VRDTPGVNGVWPYRVRSISGWGGWRSYTESDSVGGVSRLVSTTFYGPGIS